MNNLNNLAVIVLRSERAVLGQTDKSSRKSGPHIRTHRSHGHHDHYLVFGVEYHNFHPVNVLVLEQSQ